MEMKYITLLQAGSGSIFDKFLHGASFISVHTIAVISYVTYFFTLFFSITEKSRGYGRVLRIAITTSAEKRIFWFVV